MKPLRLACLALSLALLACNRDSPSSAGGGTGTTAAALSVKGSCNNAPKGFCNDFTGGQYNASQVEAACKLQGVAFSAAACPAAGRVGSCQVQAGQPLESHYRYYAAFPGGKAAAEAQCKNLLRGAWTSP